MRTLPEKTVVPVVALAPKTLCQEMARALRVSMVVKDLLASPLPLVAVVVALVLPELTVVMLAGRPLAVTAVMVFLRLSLVPL